MNPNMTIYLDIDGVVNVTPTTEPELDQVQSLSVGDHLHTMHEIYWNRGSYRPSDEEDLRLITERGFRPGQPRDMEVYHTWQREHDEELRRLMEERNLNPDRTFHL